MIRHRPFGSGHPYSVDTEQRWPIDPVAGEPVVLGVRTSSEVTAAAAEVVRDGGEPRSLDLEATARTSRGQSTDGGHLASAQARLARTSGGWQLRLDGLRPGEHYRYRFVASGARRQSTRWFDFRVAGWRPAPGAVRTVGPERVIPGSEAVLDDGVRTRRVRFALPIADAEHVTGLGERFDALDHRGTSLDSVVFEQYKSQGAERKTYLPMPFAHIVGAEGWGFHVRTSRRVWFDFAEQEAGRIWVEAEVDGASGDVSVLDLAVYEGTPTSVLDQFLAEAGRPTELPSWIFRLWASANEWNTQREVMRQMDLHREHDIPVGSVVIEAWSDESTFTAWRDSRYAVTKDGAPHRLADFDFPPDGAWPDPKGMVDELHAREIRLHLWQIPLVKMRPHPKGQAAADAAAAIREGVLVQEEALDGSLRPYRNRGWWFPLGLMPDLTDDRAAKWWTEKRRYLVDEIGVDGFKTDGGEHAWGRDLRYLDGRHGDEGNALFPVHYAKAFGDLLESAGKAPVTFSRAGFTGSQAHGTYWAGDENSTWEAFRWSLFAGLSAASSGIVYWGWDLGGFSGEVPDGELYLRSAAAAAFVPIMQYHAEFNHHRLPSGDRTPWNIAERNDDDRVLPTFRRFAKLRERLVPYLADQARATIETSAPLMRPLYFDAPHDENVWRHPLQWMLGDDLLVCPVTEAGATEWATYLPAGEWVDAWSGDAVEGGRVVKRPAPIDEIPIYVRAAAWPRVAAVFGD
ncbi:TIM-barrel domain-containing protein [Lacisediminihabitans sp.]|uniref:glycoside hydrolase family 31 protein n=1 Tax=Lacisediminihabitans sp. TaxID=2787631 RepID=UPI00374DB1F3